jgi:hypothetical protein
MRIDSCPRKPSPEVLVQMIFRGCLQNGHSGYLSAGASSKLTFSMLSMCNPLLAGTQVEPAASALSRRRIWWDESITVVASAPRAERFEPQARRHGQTRRRRIWGKKKEAGHYSGLSTRTKRKFLRLLHPRQMRRADKHRTTHTKHCLLHPNDGHSITHPGFLACHHFWLHKGEGICISQTQIFR